MKWGKMLESAEGQGIGRSGRSFDCFLAGYTVGREDLMEDLKEELLKWPKKKEEIRRTIQLRPKERMFQKSLARLIGTDKKRG